MSGETVRAPVDMTRHVLPVGAVVTIVIFSLMGWFQLEAKLDLRMAELLAPVQKEVERLDEDQKLDRKDVLETLKAMNKELQDVQKSLIRLEEKE